MTTTTRLTVLTGPHRGTRFCCHPSVAVTLGRASDCDICLNDGVADLVVSRRHCRLELDNDSMVVQDLASRNGTYVNGRRVTKDVDVCEVVESGDLLTIGDITLQVHQVDCPVGDQAVCEARWPADQTILKNCPLGCRA